jgi:hypothetical protein
LDQTWVDIVVTPNGLLQLVAADGSGRLEVGPLTKEAALSLAKQLVDFACPEEALKAARPAGEA